MLIVHTHALTAVTWRKTDPVVLAASCCHVLLAFSSVLPFDAGWSELNQYISVSCLNPAPLGKLWVLKAGKKYQAWPSLSPLE